MFEIVVQRQRQTLETRGLHVFQPSYRFFAPNLITKRNKRRMKKDEEINKKNFKQWEDLNFDFFRFFLILRASFTWNGTKRQRNSIRVSFFTRYINTKDNVSSFLLRISVNRGIKFLCLIKIWFTYPFDRMRRRTKLLDILLEKFAPLKSRE